MEMKAGLTFACMNLKKLAKILSKREERSADIFDYFRYWKESFMKIEKNI